MGFSWRSFGPGLPLSRLAPDQEFHPFLGVAEVHFGHRHLLQGIDAGRDDAEVTEAEFTPLPTKWLKVFEKLGFTHLIHLDEGFGGWEAAGKPVVK